MTKANPPPIEPGFKFTIENEKYVEKLAGFGDPGCRNLTGLLYKTMPAPELGKGRSLVSLTLGSGGRIAGKTEEKQRVNHNEKNVCAGNSRRHGCELDLRNTHEELLV
ncbi:hypothetical protein L1887_31903 [Cichorium endivia]|nr:hypothetical protein L1887_31903 [Cichorium endivia]